MSAQEAVRETALACVQDVSQAPATRQVASYGAFTQGVIFAGMVLGVPAGLIGAGWPSRVAVPLALAATAWAIHRRAGWAPLRAVFTARLAPQGQGLRFAAGCLVSTAAVAYVLISGGGR